MRDTIGVLTQKWRNRGHSLGFGVGVALGYATLGQIGYEQRLEYAAIGSVTNLASRLCDEAKAGQIVVSQRVFGMVEQWAEGRQLEDLTLKGFNHPILAVEILRGARGVRWRRRNARPRRRGRQQPCNERSSDRPSSRRSRRPIAGLLAPILASRILSRRPKAWNSAEDMPMLMLAQSPPSDMEDLKQDVSPMQQAAHPLPPPSSPSPPPRSPRTSRPRARRRAPRSPCSRPQRPASTISSRCPAS